MSLTPTPPPPVPPDDALPHAVSRALDDLSCALDALAQAHRLTPDWLDLVQADLRRCALRLAVLQATLTPEEPQP